MQVPDQTMKQILSTLPVGQRREVLSTLKGEVAHYIKCLSKTCKGRLIGHLYSDQPARVKPVRDNKGKVWMWSYRRRLDGYLGFKCMCGNDSRIAKQEEGIFDYKGTVPNKAGMEKVFNNVRAKPSKYPINKGKQEIDGFLLEEIER